MGFKGVSLKTIGVFLVVCLVLIAWVFLMPVKHEDVVVPHEEVKRLEVHPVKESLSPVLGVASQSQEALIQEQLDVDRRQQKRTKELKNRLEQT
ncbi:MAG: hypothetical protein HQL13_06000, partial [Candidatus Omnitrophica bacterium]|nr:hypothetical protein [Candidatus Omnitrophota bacterium]